MKGEPTKQWEEFFETQVGNTAVKITLVKVKESKKILALVDIKYLPAFIKTPNGYEKRSFEGENKSFIVHCPDQKIEWEIVRDGECVIFSMTLREYFESFMNQPKRQKKLALKLAKSNIADFMKEIQPGIYVPSYPVGDRERFALCTKRKGTKEETPYMGIDLPAKTKSRVYRRIKAFLEQKNLATQAVEV